MTTSFNIFTILDLPNQERPHDKALAWLLDPRGGHGIDNLATEVIKRVWGVTLNGGALRVTRQFSLPGGLRPDVYVELDSAVLMVENKVDPAALRPGQIADQNAAVQSLLKGRRLFHLLIRPDRVRTDGLVIEDPSFRELTYGQLGALLHELTLSLPEGVGRSQVMQFADYVNERYGQPAPLGIRMASGTVLARRYSGSSWSETEFLEHAEKTCSPEVMTLQRELLDLLRSMESVRVEFDAKGKTNPTYKVYLEDTPIHLLWVYADGRLYPTWKPLRSAGIADGVDEWKRLWGTAIKAENQNDSFAEGGLAVFPAEEVARKLQAVSDFARAKEPAITGADSTDPARYPRGGTRSRGE
jgi:hypothetical protein